MSDQVRDIAVHVKEILSLLGEDAERDGLQETPKRVAKALLELTKGYTENPEEHLSRVFDSSSRDMVIVDNIPFTSLCEHHMLPFSGVCHIGYVPGGGTDVTKIVGLSKLARTVHVFSRRLQVQEQLTKQIADAITDSLNPEGCIVVMKAQHQCMSMRGVQVSGSWTKTAAVRGIFEDNKDGTKDEFYTLLGEV